ncbi:hypothetical protein [Kocuria rosea]|uniref:hypothetical protein n=1 Tax=Kocuria rosea TaxID=1275 RepID=UPI002540CEFD|nr:hypothetical protein [Kocuria rosea]WIG18381.1 hypothetical protein QOY29_05485 [Kocuria rosea]
MLHHSLEEPHQPYTGDDFDACLKRADRFARLQREQRREHCRSLTDSELCAELTQAREAMRDRLQDAGNYLVARERRNAAITVMTERGMRDTSRSFRESGMGMG